MSFVIVFIYLFIFFCPDLIEGCLWNNFEDIASGEVVAVAGNGISLSGFVSLFQVCDVA